MCKWSKPALNSNCQSCPYFPSSISWPLGVQNRPQVLSSPAKIRKRCPPARNEAAFGIWIGGYPPGLCGGGEQKTGPQQIIPGSKGPGELITGSLALLDTHLTTVAAVQKREAAESPDTESGQASSHGHVSDSGEALHLEEEGGHLTLRSLY